MKIAYHITLLTLLSICSLAVAQDEETYPRLPFVHLDMDASTGTISEVLKDSRGYLWIGTDFSGLWRYDGYQAIKYPETGDGVRSVQKFITKLREDSEGNLWIGTGDGLYRYVHATDSFVRYNSRLEHPEVRDIYETRSGEIWYTTNRDIHRYDRETDTFETFPFPSSEKKGFHLKDICQDQQGKYWVSCNESGLFLFDPDSGEFEKVDDPNASREHYDRFLFSDSRGQIWVGTRGNGLICFDSQQRKFIHYPTRKEEGGTSGAYVSDILEYPEGQLLVALNQGGLNRLNLDTGAFSYQRKNDQVTFPLCSDGLADLHLGLSGELWVGTNRTGVDYYDSNEGLFYSYDENSVFGDTKLKGNVICGFFEDQDGEVWITLDGGGIGVLNRESHTLTNIGDMSAGDDRLRAGVISAIQQDDQGIIWVCAWNGGITFLEKSNGKIIRNRSLDRYFEKYTSKQLSGCQIDSSGRIWISDYAGSIHLHHPDLTFAKTISHPKYKYGVRSTIHETSKGILLQAPGRTFLFNEETQDFETLIIHERARCSYYDPESDLLMIGMRKYGLHVFDRDGKLIDEIDTDDGLSSNYIASIQPADNGELWISTNNGINRLDYESRSIVQFSTMDGLPCDEYFDHASIKLNDGKLMFGGTSGFTLFDPNTVTSDNRPTPVYLEDILINNESILENELNSESGKHPHSATDLTLNWDEQSVAFHFVGVNILHSKKIQYAYKLEGFDKDWIQTTYQSRFAKYTNLDAGNYVFKVKASSPDGVLGEEWVALNLTITPPVWETFGFRLLVVILFFGVLFGVYRLRVSHFKHLKIKLESQVAERTQELQSVNQDLAESNAMKDKFFGILAHDLRSPIASFRSLSEIIVDEIHSRPNDDLKDVVKTLNSSSKDLFNLLENLLQWAKIQQGVVSFEPIELNFNRELQEIFEQYQGVADKKKILLRNDIPETLQVLVDPNVLLTILRNMVSNAIKFTESGGNVRVYLASANENTVTIGFEDSGIGMNEALMDQLFRIDVKSQRLGTHGEPSTGLGLILCKAFIEKSGGEIRVESEEDKGTIFLLTLPVAKC